MYNYPKSGGSVIGLGLYHSEGRLYYLDHTKTAYLDFPPTQEVKEHVRFEFYNLEPEDYARLVAASGGEEGLSRVVLPAVCFLRGTMIQTTNGEVAVENLNPGDVVSGKSGERTVKWVGFRKNYTHRIPHNQRADHLPIRIVRDAIAENVPNKDIVVSPGHHIYIENKLVRAKDLVNGKTIYQETHHVSYDYFHVELDQFDVILAHGLLSESWADGGNRDYFQNVDVTSLRPHDRHRRRADRPGFKVVRDKAELDRLQAIYAARADLLEQSEVRMKDKKVA